MKIKVNSISKYIKIYSKLFLLSFSIIFIIEQAQAQSDIEYRAQNFSKHILANSETGYLTFLGGMGNIESLWFEGVLVPSYSLRIHEDAKWGTVLVPKIVIRMYRLDSQPVNTPSYMPQISFYYQVNDPTDNFNNLFYIFARFVHHSNGQDGDFFNEDGSLNKNSGDFSTNYFEVGAFLTKLLAPRLNATEFYRTSLEFHPHFLQYYPLYDLYGNLRWHNDIQLFKISMRSFRSIFTGTDDINYTKTEKRPTIRARLNTTLIFGEMNGASALDLSKRLSVSATLSYHPALLRDVRIFAQYYYGQDYYNMDFDNTLNVLRVGLMMDPFNL
ncbi:MAG: hypothetical protein KAI81_07635 [Candidatus Marinimicrobia bacterium]|nr:hypothetical protein [Candidatus Neomarinimicrobiota bacterium]